MNETSARLGGLIESLIFVIIFVVIYWLLGPRVEATFFNFQVGGVSFYFQISK